MVSVFVEAIIVGLLLIPSTYAAGYVAKRVVKKPMLPDVCSTWNENYIMEVNVFLAGFLFHIIAEYTGLNKMYCASKL